MDKIATTSMILTKLSNPYIYIHTAENNITKLNVYVRPSVLQDEQSLPWLQDARVKNSSSTTSW